ncbi:hypothetical protein GGR57DRAFT_306665 [Xylariaceae sp. FL1272]|nr:hypothetical protein GGR57DRAFT_306665 [Xylariaceae sp. FL1272]
MSETDTRSFSARCHCRNILYTVELLTSDLTLNAWICGCNTCRHTHGTFAAFYITLPKGVAPKWMRDDVQLTQYNPNSGHHGTLNFCASCGAHQGYYDDSTSQWTLDLCLFESPFWNYTSLTSAHSSPDGGMLPWVPQFNDLTDHDVNPTTSTLPKDDEKELRVECHCGGVSFTIARPTPAIQADSYMQDYVSPLDPMKWKAFIDFCSDCRLLTGAPFVPWILVPRVSISPPLPPNLEMGTMKTYASSEKSLRSFCGKCGATVFIKSGYRTPTEEQTVLNLAMGILRASEGARAEKWVTWRCGKPAWVDDTRDFDKEFADGLIEGHGDWGREVYGEDLRFEVI